LDATQAPRIKNADASAPVGSHYQSFEALVSDIKISWVADGDLIANEVRTNIVDISDAYLRRIFGRRNGIRDRAWKRIVGGSFDFSNLKMSKLKMKSSGADVVVFKGTCVPSMKQPEYDFLIVFDLQTHMYIPAPVSRCGCPAGQFFCSHMLAWLVCICLLQSFPAVSFADFVRGMPQPIKSIVAVPVPWSLMFSISSDSDDSDIASKASEILGELQGTREGEGAEEEVETTVGTEVDGLEVREAESTDIICFARRYFAESMARGESSEGSSAGAPRCAISTASIESFTSHEMLDRAGPHPDEFVRERDELFERLHALYENKRLSKTLFAAYLKYYAPSRQSRIAAREEEAVGMEPATGDPDL
jgi:hypothetical protein